jgi:hypothetical protein
MPSHHILLTATLLACTACGADQMVRMTPAPPSPILVGTVRVVPDGNGQLGVEVAAHVSNSTNVHFHLGTASNCPLYVRIFPDSTGEPIGVGGFPDPCPSSLLTIDLAPGDSIVLTQFTPASVFTSLPPMLYGFNVGVAFDQRSITGWAGSVRVPLKPATSGAPANTCCS